MFEEGEEELDSEHGNIYLRIYHMTDKNGVFMQVAGTCKFSDY